MNVSPTPPKEQWLADEKTASEWAEIVANPVFKKALTYALSELSWREPAAEEIRGAMYFQRVLCSLSDKHEAPRHMPAKLLSEGEKKV